MKMKNGITINNKASFSKELPFMTAKHVEIRFEMCFYCRFRSNYFRGMW